MYNYIGPSQDEHENRLGFHVSLNNKMIYMNGPIRPQNCARRGVLGRLWRSLNPSLLTIRPSQSTKILMSFSCAPQHWVNHMFFTVVSLAPSSFECWRFFCFLYIIDFSPPFSLFTNYLYPANMASCTVVTISFLYIEAAAAVECQTHSNTLWYLHKEKRFKYFEATKYENFPFILERNKEMPPVVSIFVT